MNKMDFDSVGRWLSEKGFMAVNVNETETPRGINMNRLKLRWWS